MTKLREIQVHADAGAETRTESFMGRDYFVVPVVALVEGVLQGANASNPEYVPAQVIEKLAIQWNGRPVVQNHPQIRGQYVSANDPKVMEEWAYGFIANARSEDKKLKVEAWIDTARAQELGGDFADTLSRLQAGEPVEVSTGLYCDIVPQRGTFNGKSYTGMWDNVVSDHLAMLSAGTLGACSIADGCGAPRLNVMSAYEEESMATSAPRQSAKMKTKGKACGCDSTDGTCICPDGTDASDNQPTAMEAPTASLADLSPAERDARIQAEVGQTRGTLLPRNQSIASTVLMNDAWSILSRAIKTKMESQDSCAYCFLLDATTDVAVYQQYGADWSSEKYKISYSMDAAGNVVFTSEPEPVILLTQILPKPKVNEGASADGATTDTTPPTEGTTVITNSTPNPDQRGDAMAGENSGTTADPSAPAVNGGTPAVAPATEAAPVVNAAAPVARFNSMEELYAAIPSEMAQVLQEGVRLQAARRTELTTAIKANASNKFSDAQLNSFDTPTLESIAVLAATPAPAAPAEVPNSYVGRFFGMGAAPAADVTDAQAPKANAADNGFGAPPVPAFVVNTVDSSHRVGAFKH